MSANLMSLAQSGGKFLKLFGDRKMMKTILTARDYVQDGLIAMWDGIENAGWGVHDSNATTWKDLVGSNDFTGLVGNFGSDCYVFNYNFGWQTDVINEISAVCVELVIKPGNTRNKTFEIYINSQKTPVLLSPYSSMQQYLQCGGQNERNTKGRIPVSNVLAIRSVSANYTNYAALSATVDGLEISADETSDAWTFNSGFRLGGDFRKNQYRHNGEINNLRLYNRALTAAEIASNYAIDKARFNLPD